MAQVVSRRSLILECGFDSGPIRVGFVAGGGVLNY